VWSTARSEVRGLLIEPVGVSNTGDAGGSHGAVQRMAWAFEQAVGLVWYYEVSNPLVSLWGRRAQLDRLLHEDGEV
jgi:hypothetical protein